MLAMNFYDMCLLDSLINIPQCIWTGCEVSFGVWGPRSNCTPTLFRRRSRRSKTAKNSPTRTGSAAVLSKMKTSKWNAKRQILLLWTNEKVSRLYWEKILQFETCVAVLSFVECLSRHIQLAYSAYVMNSSVYFRQLFYREVFQKNFSIYLKFTFVKYQQVQIERDQIPKCFDWMSTVFNNNLLIAQHNYTRNKHWSRYGTFFTV